ncbi:GntR family transcriptional regulator [Clostridium oryzae]|uniref:HTH-type transcriptional repressor YtrA n=1 Tax=Clostridium oryzae TaxID=1450648 RepID=A0A1V4I9D2_9CLOT|nr:GntR family transcriptional regulator [Clostridium oryzae]OPJ56602.1 HTH-type transcriptional repressor YtrA [Clostridium oryzae]
MKIEFNSTLPIYLQIMKEIKRQIVSGELVPGSKISSVRELAQEMGVNPNTMQRAFSELEREGLLYTERTSGRFITTDSELIEKLKEETAENYITFFLDAMNKLGFDNNHILKLLKSFMKGD